MPPTMSLLIRRSDNQNWAVPGGAIDLGESMVQAAVRETKEETGIDCEITGLARAASSEQARTANQRLTDVARHVIDADFPPCPAGNCDAAAGTRR